MLLNTSVSRKGHIVCSSGHFGHGGKNALGKRIPKVPAWTRDHAETAQQWFQVACIASAWRPQGTPRSKVPKMRQRLAKGAFVSVLPKANPGFT